MAGQDKDKNKGKSIEKPNEKKGNKGRSRCQVNDPGRTFITPGHRRKTSLLIQEPDATSSSIPPPCRPTPPAHTTILPAYRPTPPVHTTILPEYQPTPPAYTTIVPEYRPTPPAYTIPGVPISNNLFGRDGTPFLEMMETFGTPQQQHQQQQQQQQQRQEPPQQQQQPPLEQEGEHVVDRRRRRKITGEVEVVGERAIIEPIGDSLRPSKEAAKGIRIAIKRVYLKPYPSYKEMMKDEKVKEKIFEEFSRVCTWEPHHDEQVEQNFHRIAARRLADMLHDAREEYLDRPGERPLWIGEEIWPQLVEYWRTDSTFLNRSRANKKNRGSIKGGNLHTQGSVGLVDHAMHLAKKLGRSVHVDEVHRETHLKYTGAYVDARSEKTQDLFEEYLQEFLQQHTEYSSRREVPEAIIMQLWDRAKGPGGTDHRRYGFGPLAPNFRHGSLLYVPDHVESSRHAGLTPEAQELIEKLTQDLQQRDQAALEMRQRMERIEQHAEQQRKWEEQLRAYFAAMNCPIPPPPPPPYASSSSHAAVDSAQSDNEDADDSDSA